MTNGRQLLRRVTVTAAVSWLIVSALCAGADTPDLAWSPEPFGFGPGPSVRYVDFEAGEMPHVVDICLEQ